MFSAFTAAWVPVMEPTHSVATLKAKSVVSIPRMMGQLMGEIIDLVTNQREFSLQCLLCVTSRWSSLSLRTFLTTVYWFVGVRAFLQFSLQPGWWSSWRTPWYTTDVTQLHLSSSTMWAWSPLCQTNAVSMITFQLGLPVKIVAPSSSTLIQHGWMVFDDDSHLPPTVSFSVHSSEEQASFDLLAGVRPSRFSSTNTSPFDPIKAGTSWLPLIRPNFYSWNDLYLVPKTV